MVARSPNATYESNGQPKVLPWMVRLPTNEFFVFCKKKFARKLDRQLRRYHIHGLAQDCSFSIANAPEILQSCTKPSVCLCTCVWVKREYRLARFDQFFNWFYGLSILLTDHPELRRTTQPSIMGGPLGDPGFCFFSSTVLFNHYVLSVVHTVNALLSVVHTVNALLSVVHTVNALLSVVHTVNALLSVTLLITCYVDGLVQDCSISIANAVEILQCCTKPSM